MLASDEAVDICNGLVESGRRLDQAEPQLSTSFLLLAPGSRAFSFLPANLMDMLKMNYAMLQGAIDDRTNYLEHLIEQISVAEARLKRATGEPDTSVN
jgi:hypothetical protein